ncbi:MAG: SPOR domain-containing protein [Treponema sp.]|nr:SPOR domain-containing protein [Treponema sp.]
MKKLLLVLIFFSLTFSVFSYEQIGNRLKYEVGINQILIKDVYDSKSISIRFQQEMNYTFHIYNNYTHIGTANIHSNDFTPFMAQLITSWSLRNGGNDEWRQNAALIANKIASYIREQYPLPNGRQPPGIQLIRNFQPGMFYVQIGAYSNLATANSEIAKVDSNLPRAIMQVTVNIRGMNINVNKVLIGPLDNAQSVSVLQRYRLYYSEAFIHI